MDFKFIGLTAMGVKWLQQLLDGNLVQGLTNSSIQVSTGALVADQLVVDGGGGGPEIRTQVMDPRNSSLGTNHPSFIHHGFDSMGSTFVLVRNRCAFHHRYDKINSQ